MAEEDYVSYQQYRADLADFRADMARFREEVRAELGSIRRDVSADINSLKEDISSLKVENAGIRQEIYRLHGDTIKWLAGIVATGVALTVTLVKLLP